MTPSETHSITLPNSMLKSYGCKNCVWKTYGQCPKGFTKQTESLPDGYCIEFGNFLLSIAEREDSISAVKEKFMLYTQEMEAMADHMRFKELQVKYELAKDEGRNDNECAELIMGIQLYKTWWARLTDNVVKGLGRIADRERRSKDVQGTQKITVQQLNVLLKESDEVLKKLE